MFINPIFNHSKYKKIIYVDTIKLRPPQYKFREYIDNKEINELALSIKQNNILQPLLVRKKPKFKKGEYEIICGERRYRASVLIGIKKIPCIVKNLSDENAFLYSIADNIQQNSLSSFEIANSLGYFKKMFHVKHSDISDKLIKNNSFILNKLSLLGLDKDEQELILEGNLTENQAIALLTIKDKKIRLLAISRIIEYNLNLPQSIELINSMINKGFGLPLPKEKTIIIKDIRIFVNTINKAISTMKQSGITPTTNRIENDEYIEYSIKIPKKFTRGITA